MTAAQGGILWRIARLHPGWVTLAVWFGSVVYVVGYVRWFGGAPLLAVASFAGFMLFYMGYPLFVLLFLPGRSRTWAPPRRERALVAFFAIEIFVVAGILAGPETINAVSDAANAGDLAANFALGVPFSILAGSFFYLFIGAALTLVAAEHGKPSRLWRKFVTFFQFFYLPICVYFLHRRIRRLVHDFENGDPIVVSLPLGSLKIERQAGGHLYLLLTERIGWEDFERYANELLHRLDGRVAAKGSAADMHLWNVEIETLPFRLVYDDYPNGVTLESESHAGDMLLRKLQERLALSPAVH